MLYLRLGLRKCVFFIIYSVPKIYSYLLQEAFQATKGQRVCTRMSSYVSRMWFFHEPKKRARNKSTFFVTCRERNYTKTKISKSFFNTFATFYIFLLVLSILFTHALKGFESSLVSINVWNFPWMINGYWKFILFWCF